MENFFTNLPNMIFFKDSFTFKWLRIAAVFIVFIFIFSPMFLFFMFYFVFFNLLRCVLFLTEPHAYVNLSYILLKKNNVVIGFTTL